MLKCRWSSPAGQIITTHLSVVCDKIHETTSSFVLWAWGWRRWWPRKSNSQTRTNGKKACWAEVLEYRDTLIGSAKVKCNRLMTKWNLWKDLKKKFHQLQPKSMEKTLKKLEGYSDRNWRMSKQKEYFWNHEEHKNYQSWICELRFKFQRVRTMKSGEEQYLPSIWPFSVFSLANPDFGVFSNADVVIMQSQCQTLKQTLML